MQTVSDYCSHKSNLSDSVGWNGLKLCKLLLICYERSNMTMAFSVWLFRMLYHFIGPFFVVFAFVQSGNSSRRKKCLSRESVSGCLTLVCFDQQLLSTMQVLVLRLHIKTIKRKKNSLTHSNDKFITLSRKAYVFLIYLYTCVLFKMLSQCFIYLPYSDIIVRQMK